IPGACGLRRAGSRSKKAGRLIGSASRRDARADVISPWIAQADLPVTAGHAPAYGRRRVRADLRRRRTAYSVENSLGAAASSVVVTVDSLERAQGHANLLGDGLRPPKSSPEIRQTSFSTA